MAFVPRINPFMQVSPIANPKDGTPTPYFIQQMQPLQEVAAGSVPSSRKVGTTSGELTGGGPLTGDLSLGLANSGVTPGAYTAANITVDAFGRVTAASSGGGGGNGLIIDNLGAEANAGPATSGTDDYAISGNYISVNTTVAIAGITAYGSWVTAGRYFPEVYDINTSTGAMISKISTTAAAWAPAQAHIGKKILFFDSHCTLTAGHNYAIVIRRTDSTSTTPIPYYYNSTGADFETPYCNQLGVIDWASLTVPAATTVPGRYVAGFPVYAVGLVFAP